MTLETAEQFLGRTQPQSWRTAADIAARVAREMVRLDWSDRARLFDTVLGMLANETSATVPNRDDRQVVWDRETAGQFVANASAVLAGVLLELAGKYSVNVEGDIISPEMALLLASCPVDTLADAGMAYFKKPGGGAMVEAMLTKFENFRLLAVADKFERQAVAHSKVRPSLQ
jgi:hypothetical protein